MSDRVLVACVGNVLRGDDGFGFAVAQRLAERDDLPGGVEVIETGIGGLGIVLQLLDGYAALVIVDAVERRAPPGTVFVLEPQVPDPQTLTLDAWRAAFSNLHLAEPSRVLLLARAAGALPQRVVIVGCQPADCDRIGEGLSGPVATAVDVATRRICDLLADDLTARDA